MKPIIFYAVRSGRFGRSGRMKWSVSYRIFYEDRYVIWTPEVAHISSVSFDLGNPARDRAFALATFRNDPDTWTELE